MIPHPHWIDYAVIGIYFVFVLGIGFVLKKYLKTSADFFRRCDRFPPGSPD